MRGYDVATAYIESEENGFWLVIDGNNEDGIAEEWRFHIHDCALDLLASVDKTIRPYWQEAEDARRTYVPPAGGMTPEEIEDVYHDDPGKLHSMREQVNRPW